MLVTTPFVLIFYLLIIGVSIDLVINGTESDPGFSIFGLIAAIIMITIFLVPGLVILYF